MNQQKLDQMKLAQKRAIEGREAFDRLLKNDITDSKEWGIAYNPKDLEYGFGIIDAYEIYVFMRDVM